jgi:hypothetical protein
VKSGEAGGGADRRRGGAVSMGHQDSVCGRFWGRQGTGEVARRRQGDAAVALRFPAKRWPGLANKRRCKL